MSLRSIFHSWLFLVSCLPWAAALSATLPDRNAKRVISGLEVGSANLPQDIYSAAQGYTKNLNNLIWVYAASSGVTNAQDSVNTYYPGNDFVDIVGVDGYKDTIDNAIISSYNRLRQNGKPFALTEYGPATPPGRTLSNSGTFNFSTLSVTNSGTGYGSVASSPMGISCYSPEPGVNYFVAPDCSENYASGTNVVLTAYPVTGSTFTGWSGDCSGTGPCTVTMNANKSVSASFTSLTATTDCLFNWAESQYPKLFAPAHPSTKTYGDYTLRYYSQTNSYLGISSGNEHLYYYAPSSSSNALLDLGLAATWMTQAGCSQ